MSAPHRPSTNTVASLGKKTYEVKPSTTNIVAGFVLSGILFFGGLSLAGMMVRQMFFPPGLPLQTGSDWLGVIFLALLGLGLAAGGVLLFRFSRSMLGFQLFVCSEGFWFIREGKEHVFAWTEVVKVQEQVQYEKLPLVKGPAQRLISSKAVRTFTVIRCDGEQFYFDENVIPRPSLLSGPLSSAAKRHNIPWETEESES